MKIDEQEFRNFIANLNKYLNESDKHVFSEIEQSDYEILENKIDNQIGKYLEMLETPKPSRWKQLKIDL